MNVYLRRARPEDLPEVREAYRRSADLHAQWTSAPSDFSAYLAAEGRYFVCLENSHDIAGSFHVSGVIRGCFHSAYLGYEVFHPYQRKGYMSQGIQLLLKEAFGVLKLHRLEANIQPENSPSIRLVNRAGFIKEGFSAQYLRINGEWRDHERWAIVNAAWRDCT